MAFILMSAATSIPELAVGISSAFHKIPELAFGTIIGSNVIKLSLIVGLVSIIGGFLPIEKTTVVRNSFFTAIYALLPLFLILDGDISRIDGAILILAFFFYIAWLFDQKEKFTKVYEGVYDSGIHHKFVLFLKSMGGFFGAVVLLILSSEIIIRSARFFVDSWGIPLGVLGLLLLGAGAALPEGYFSVAAARRGHKEMILGNLMGGVVLTSSAVLGIVALISPIKIFDFSPYLSARFFLLVSVGLFLFFLRTRKRISRKEGIILLLVYLAFLVFELKQW